MRGKIKRVFPGNNTSEGFFSFYDQIIPSDAQRIYILKGGPGVGKSGLMKDVSNMMADKGYDVECHHCSSDSTSLDAVVIPALSIAIIDGTAPHVVDPKTPGAVDEIVYLGDYWDEAKLKPHKEKIISYDQRKKRFFHAAYCNLKEARAVNDELKGYYTDAFDKTAVMKIRYEIAREFFENVKANLSRPARIRRLFASANTPEGPVQYLTTILREVQKLYIIKGEPGLGAETILQDILWEGERLGLDGEAYHCPFIPANLELVCFPSLKKAALRLNGRLDFDPGSLKRLTSLEITDLNQYLDVTVIGEYQKEISSAQERIKACFNRAWDRIADAKRVHAEMEALYVAAMDFAGVEEKKAQIASRILQFAGII